LITTIRQQLLETCLQSIAVQTMSEQNRLLLVRNSGKGHIQRRPETNVHRNIAASVSSN